MKALLCIFILGFSFHIKAGPALPPEPIKFLVLQRSDVLEDDSPKPTNFTAIESEAQDEVAVTEAEDIEITTIEYVRDEFPDAESVSQESVKKYWNPADGWRELNFTIVPEVNAEFETVTRYQPESGTINTISRLKVPNKRIACRCGNAGGRIVGGEEARVNDIPWTAALVRNGFFGFGASKKPYCGATLINDLYVVTASHCVDGMFAGGLKVWLNEEDYLIDTETTGRQEYLVDEIIMNENYDRRTVNNDIALLKLANRVPLGVPESVLTPVCLPANNDVDFSGITATVAGWGLTSDGGSQAKALRKVDVPILTNEFCNSDQTKYKGKISENMLCAGYESGGKDSCQGDSGGPLIIQNNDRKTLVGIVSWGFGCAEAKAPGVYTRVARYPTWILENTKDAQWCSE